MAGTQANKILGPIREAALSQKTIILEYRDADGKVTQREAEPYEINDKGLYAFALNRDAIRLFKIDNIISVRNTGHPFIPRFPIKIT